MVKPRLWDKLLFLIYPNSCMCCAEPIDSGSYICGDCLRELNKLRSDKVRRFSHKRREVRVCSVYRYDGVAASAIKRLKFGYAATSARPLGVALANRVRRLKCDRFDVVCCVPMTGRAVAERGFNQAELIAHVTARELGIKYVPRAVSKIRETAEQHKLQGSARLRNVSGAFKADSRAVSGRSVLIIDDVVTTGATLCECTAALLSAGAKSVFCATVASAAKAGR